MKKLASVTNNEKKEFERLVERNNSLVEVKKILEDVDLIKQQEQDLLVNEKELNILWDKILKKYNLENVKDSCNFINFEDNCIYSK